MELKVMTFNLRIDVPEDGKNQWTYRLPYVVSTIKQSGASVVGTQEGSKRMIQALRHQLPCMHLLVDQEIKMKMVNVVKYFTRKIG